MSKRKGRKSGVESPSKASKASTDEGDEDEISSQISMSRTNSRMSQMSVASSQGDEGLSIEDQFTALIDDLESKKAASRVTGTLHLQKLLANKFLKEQIAAKDVDLVIDLSRKLVGADGPESIAFTKCLSAIWITWGPEADRYTSVSKILSNTIKNASSSLQAASILSLALITVLEDAESQVQEDLLLSLSTLISKEDVADEVLAAALCGYGLVYGHCESKRDKEEMNEIIDRHIELLEHSSLEVRMGSGENLALIVEDLREREIDPTEYIDSIHELTTKLHDNSTESTKHIAKKDKSVQKSQAREFLATVEDAIPPSIDLKFKKDTVTIESWTQVKLLNAFKDAIGEGLHTHFYLNPIFQELFNWSGGTASERDNLRLFDTTVGKQRVKDLKEQRKQKVSRSGDHNQD